MLVGIVGSTVVLGAVMAGCAPASVDTTSGGSSGSVVSEVARLDRAADETVEVGQLRVTERKLLERTARIRLAVAVPLLRCQ